MPNKSSKEELIERLKEIYGNKYDCSKIEYVNSKTKVCLICPIHGEFWKTPNQLLSKKEGCPKCGREQGGVKRYNNIDDVFNKAKQIHSNKYDYSESIYKGMLEKIKIICPIHGEFWQTPHDHLKGHGCPICGQEQSQKKQSLTTTEFVEKARKVHGDKYDYSKVVYINSRTKVCIICPIHGEFWQTPEEHLNNHGCPKCGIIQNAINRSKTKEQFIEDARKKHGNIYDYSKVVYINNWTKVCIICPIHGEFWQTPDKHLQGHGCVYCKSSRLENEIRQFLIENNIEFEQQKRFNWLGLQTLDFYLIKHDIAIECQGVQHFKHSDFFGGEKGLERTIERDQRKRILCEQNGVTLLYYSNLGIKYPYDVIEDKNKILDIIKNEKDTFK